MKLVRLFACILITTNSLLGQESGIGNFKKEYLNWYNKDYALDGVLGASIDKTYDSILIKLRLRDTIIVAVIDGGVDIFHEDLKGRVWFNKGEIANNNIDDDGNGYIDDVNGWNFIGNKSGENIQYENYEFTRIVKEKNTSDINYIKSKQLYDEELKKRKSDSTNYEKFEYEYNKAKSIIFQTTGINVKNINDLNSVSSYNQGVANAKQFLISKYSQGFSEKGLENFKKRNVEFLNYFLNINYNPRGLVGDNPSRFEDKNYGNNDVKGPRPEHGTSVAGLIAAIRNNGKGVNGISASTQIMSLRVVPVGDERDKDIALAIIYAVDNGARIINMSFGKRISPNKEFVDYAVKYAEKHNVLIIHAAGNYGEDVDENETYPSDRYIDRIEAANWIDIGASNIYLNKNLPAKFSNYGKKHVDVFAPGINIISLDSGNTYSMNDGTSLSAPVVTGVASLILSYFPELTPPELISILLEGSFKIVKPRKVIKPGLADSKKLKIKFKELSTSGGIVNVYKSFLIAIERKNK